MAKAIHEQYLKNQKSKKPVSDPSMKPWDNLDENLKESNRRQADHIPEKLRKAGYGFAPVIGKEPEKIIFSPQEIEILAELEHERWVSERLTDGWTLSNTKDIEKKLSPYLVPWNELADDIKEYDRDTIRALPELLASRKFEIYKLK